MMVLLRREIMRLCLIAVVLSVWNLGAQVEEKIRRVENGLSRAARSRSSPLASG
jgi:hypothetical protein